MMIEMFINAFFLLLFLLLSLVMLVLFGIIVCFIGFVIETAIKKEGIFCRIIEVLNEIFGY